MWLSKVNVEKNKEEGNGTVAVAVDRDKSSQYALKWAVDHLLRKGQSVFLVHVNHKSSAVSNQMGGRAALSGDHDSMKIVNRKQFDNQTKEIFLPFRCFCSRKDIQCRDITLEASDVAKAITEFVAHSAIANLVVGASSRNAFIRSFRGTDIPTSVSKGAPDFCTVYIISKSKVASLRSASRPAPVLPHIQNHIENQANEKPDYAETIPSRDSISQERTPFESRRMLDEVDSIKSPFARGGYNGNGNSYSDFSFPDTDISFVSSGRPSSGSRQSIDHMFPSYYDHMESGRTPRFSTSSDITSNHSFESSRSAPKSIVYSTVSQDSESSWCSQNMDDVEAEMRKLRLELKQTMDMYSTACKEALTAQQKATELHRWKLEEQQRLEEARLAEEAALAIAEREKAKCRAALEAAEASQRIAELEAQKRVNAEMRVHKEADEKKVVFDTLTRSGIRYRKYTIEEVEVATEYFAESRKIGEGGYGPVFRGYLDHTQVAIKVLRPDAAQGRSQFQQEVEVLSCMRHPNMVLLVGACPEYGCLVYEYMAHGSLDDCLFRRGNKPALPWQLRFRIAAEIGTALLFLHQTKPEPLVHRDLKPGNILLDHNYVSKISDVGLARLVPPTVADTVTQYRMTSTAGTFCYIDPEYQQTGMLGIKSDVYSFGIMLLQIITAKPPMGLTHHVERAIEMGTFADMLDPAVPDWPVEEALCFAKLSLQCAELRRKDRPDLGKVVLPELERLRSLAEESMPHVMYGSAHTSPNNSYISNRQEVLSEPLMTQSGYSSKSHSSASS